MYGRHGERNAKETEYMLTSVARSIAIEYKRMWNVGESGARNEGN